MSKPAYVEQQFEDIEQQTHTATLGMWTFLATEILFFGVLFVSYMVCRTRWPVAFMHGSRDLFLWIGGVNTAILLTSSFFMALAVRAASLGNTRHIIIFLCITIFFGLSFLGMKGFEYAKDAHELLVPGINFSTIPPEDQGKPPAEQHPRPKQEQLFMLFYF
ncbi:MAG TPA: cytochrome c oxidase subunit 3, partial [Tepidisphaeraceae bacterium]|nr:cytochrome c oxidase subunit 3 [Tepidisphaeraceae bacterium]